MGLMVPSLYVVLLAQMTEEDTLNRILDELIELEEDILLARFHLGAHNK